MKVVAYGIQPSGKVILAQANHKKHDITLISNPLTAETAFYAQGKEAVIVFAGNDVSTQVLEFLAALGIRYLINQSEGTCLSSKIAAQHGILWVNIILSPSLQGVSLVEALQKAANQMILFLDQWKKIG